MAWEQKENAGSLFKNDKRTSENHPNATGKALIGGVEYFISAWTKTRDNGDKWQSLAFTRVKESKPASKKDVFNMDEDIPY